MSISYLDSGTLPPSRDYSLGEVLRLEPHDDANVPSLHRLETYLFMSER
jgi:hypothetical protein